MWVISKEEMRACIGAERRVLKRLRRRAARAAARRELRQMDLSQLVFDRPVLSPLCVSPPSVKLCRGLHAHIRSVQWRLALFGSVRRVRWHALSDEIIDEIIAEAA